MAYDEAGRGECPWCDGFGMDPVSGQACIACVADAQPVGDGAALTPCLAGPDDNGRKEQGGPAAGAGRRRRRPRKDGDGVAGEAPGKMSLRNFVAEFAATNTKAHRGLPLKAALAKVDEGAGEDEEDDEGALCSVPQVARSPKANEAVAYPASPSKRTAPCDPDGFGSGDGLAPFGLPAEHLLFPSA